MKESNDERTNLSGKLKHETLLAVVDETRVRLARAVEEHPRQLHVRFVLLAHHVQLQIEEHSTTKQGG